MHRYSHPELTAGESPFPLVKPEHLGTGTANSSKVLRGDQTWQSLSAIASPTGTITITRSGGLLSQLDLPGSITYTISRDGNDRISSVTNSVNTWTFTRDGDGIITSVAVA